MKVLLINGSPRAHGCTYTALEEIAKELNKENIETEILHIGNQPIRGCMACGGCFNGSGKCVYDDIVNVALDKAATADGFIFGSPVHYAGPSGQITSFLDRFFYAGKGYQYKPAAVIVSCRRGGSTAAFDQLNKYLTISCMPVVSSQYWNMVHGNTPDEVRQDLEGMQTMRTLGKNMAWLLKCIQAGKEAGISLPVPEKRISTNFIR
ncbi:MAG: FMN-dependent NADPH-azoreductase [Lachnoclostridium sp.]|jgi:multimeric flavodoxin WrbA